MVRTIFLEEYRKIKDIKIEELKCRTENGERFSLAVDEASGVSNRRFVYFITLYFLYFYNFEYYINHKFSLYRYMALILLTISRIENLGLARVKGTCPAPKMLEIVTTRLKEFEIDPNKLVSDITDGAAVCEAFGKLFMNADALDEFLSEGPIHIT